MYYLYRNGVYIVVESAALKEERIRQGWVTVTREAFVAYWRERDREARQRIAQEDYTGGTVR